MVLVERFCPKCGSATSSDLPMCTVCGASFKATIPLDNIKAQITPSLLLTGHLQTNELFRGHYRIVRRVGFGGFGAVYEAEDIQEKCQVAIKEINLANLNVQQIIDATNSFNREVELLSHLRHSSIPHIYEHLTDPQHWYVVMDYIAGETLEEALAKMPGGYMPLEQALRIAIQLCNVLEYLHSQRPMVIFRDIKPANIILSPEQKLYLVDFGVARRYKAGKLRDTIAFGSPGYAAPEQYGRAQTTPRSDLYSLGVLLHQMLSGLDPSLNPFSFQNLRAYNRKLPTELEKLVIQLLEMDMEKRPASADMVRRKLQSIASTAQAHSKRSAKAVKVRPARPQPPLSRADVLARAFSTVGLPVSIYREHQASLRSVDWSSRGRWIASSDDNKVVHIWDTLQSRSALWILPAGNYDAVWSPDGCMLATISGSQVDIWDLSNRLTFWKKFVMHLGFGRRSYGLHGTAVTALAWSPDGSKIVSAEKPGVIHIWDVRTRQQLLLYHKHADTINDLAWTPDGIHIASASVDRSVRVWNATNGENIWNWDAGKRKIAQTLAWSPDGHCLACGLNDGSVHIRNRSRSWKEQAHYKHRAAVNALAWSYDSQRLASASDDTTVHIWNVQAGKSSYIYKEHEKEVCALAWSPDGQYLASADLDALVYVWKTV